MTHYPERGHDSVPDSRPEAKVLGEARSSPHEGNATTTATTDQGGTTDAARIRELLLLNLFAVFSERDPERRLKAIVDNYTEDVIWANPEATTQGHAASNERAQQRLERTPGFVFTAAGPVHVLRDLRYLAFTLGVPAQPPASIGYDVALVREGRIGVL